MKGDAGMTLIRRDKSDVSRHKQFPGLQYKKWLSALAVHQNHLWSF